ncbi:hypothetical protein J3458_005441 [Metarhizium acridum]|uniref:uncharacterized protein n=1 Tax=Metarhizium acridum TaxID=92637 RepID=UPI001C6B4C62|nr:hypothetical protein J3458_005441 [Metarhizium acridum]
MAPSLLSLGTAALALAGNGAAVQWYLEDTYDSTNFFDKFDFMTFDDPNTGFVNYLSRTDAIDGGLATVKDKEVVLKVDSKSIVPTGRRGRDSVRLESKAKLSQGLMIARFTHLPESACGTWPAFWTVGDTWPQDGEIDIIENWNLRGVNNPAFHMANAATYGSCRIDGAGQSGEIITSNCDNQFSDGRTQWPNQGCVVKDNGPSGGSGGVYAMEWTSDFIKIYSWFPNQVPSNIDSSSPDTSLWGQPTIYLRKDLCNIDKIFKPQRIVLNIALCGNPVEFSAWEGTCKQRHGDSCRTYVAENPAAFDNVYFQIQDIRIFNQDAPKTTSTSTTSTTMASSSTSKSEISTTSATFSTKASSTSTSVTSTISATSGFNSSSSAISSELNTANTSKQTTVATSSVQNTSTWKSSNSTLSTVSKSAGSASISITSKASDSTVPTVATQLPVTFSSSVPSLSTRWPNSTIASSVEMTTSTVYTTSTRTITSCQPTVTNCPVGKVTTVTVPLYITICPVSAVETKTPSPKPTKTSGNGGNGPEKTTITTKVTKTFTITSCAPTITNCPVGKVTTEVVTTTYCPGEETAVPTSSNSGKNGNDSNSGNNGNGGKGSDKITITTKVTKTFTITSCAPTITNCPVGKVTTEVVTTTYCPGEETAVPTGSNSGNGNGSNSGINGNGGNHGNSGNNGNGGNNGNSGKGSNKITITTKVTKIYTITSCAPTVTNCPVGKVTTEVVPATYRPGEETHPTGATGPKGGFTAPPPFHPSKTIIYNTQTIVPVPKPAKPSGGNNSTSNGTSIAQPRPSGSQVCVGPSCGAEPSSPAPNTGKGGCNGPNCPPTVVSGAAKQSLSALVVLGAVAAMML